MRTNLMWLGCFMLLVAFAGSARSDEAAKKSELVTAQKDAVKNSPDVRVAVVKVELAKAELERTRRQLVQQADLAALAVEAAATHLDEMSRRVAQMMKIRQRVVGAISDDDYSAAKAEERRAQNKLALAKAELKQLLGKSEKMDEAALKSNPDVRVAAAGVVVAETELARIRKQVERNVETASLKVALAKVELEEIARRARALEKLRKNKAVSDDDYFAAKANERAARAKLALAEAELKHLIGMSTKAEDAAP